MINVRIQCVVQDGQLLRLGHAHTSPQGLVKFQVRIQSVWSGASDLAFLVGSR